MQKAVVLLFLLGAIVSTPAQENTIHIDDAVRSAQEWAKENLDEDALRALQGVDQEKARQFLTDLQKQFVGGSVVDLAQLNEVARACVPILEAHEETLPYAVWLKTRLDYLEAADEFRRLVPPPKIVPGQPAPVIPNPQPQKERDLWIKKLSNRPWPKEATPYVKQLKPVFAEEKVPGELVWVAEVESSFDPRARSPAGAAGLFQLMPVTAKQYGLRTWPFDQRLKPDESARAAAKHFHYLHGKFKDWRLALAAYNAGEGTVQRILDRQKAKTYDAIATRLPAETQLYVPKVEAVLLRREGVKLSALPPPRG